MTRYLPLLALPLLIACQTAVPQRGGLPSGFAVANAPLPPEVEAAIPADLAITNVVVRDGCFYTFVDNKIEPVVSEAMRVAGSPNQPFCAG